MQSSQKHNCRENPDNIQWELIAPASLIEDTSRESFGIKGLGSKSVIGITQHVQVQITSKSSCNQSQMR